MYDWAPPSSLHLSHTIITCQAFTVKSSRTAAAWSSTTKSRRSSSRNTSPATDTHAQQSDFRSPEINLSVRHWARLCITHSNCCQAHWITFQLTSQLAACCKCADEPLRPSRPDHTAVKPIGSPFSSPFGLQLTDRHPYKCSVACMMSGL